MRMVTIDAAILERLLNRIITDDHYRVTALSRVATKEEVDAAWNLMHEARKALTLEDTTTVRKLIYE